MKRHHSPRGGFLMPGIFACLCIGGSAVAADDIPNGTLSVDRTHVRVGVKSQANSQLSSPAADVAAVSTDGKTPAAAQAKPPEPASNVKQSVVLHDGKNWTLIPTGSVVFIPDTLKIHVNARPVGTLLAWADFLVKNRSWVTTYDVSFDQAAGNQPIPAERLTFWSRQDKIVVTVHQSGPIPVRLPDPSETAAFP